MALTYSRSDASLRALEDVVGPEGTVAPDGLGEYLDPYPVAAEACVPAAIVRPASVEELRAIVRLAAEHALPLWTVSRGRNSAYGGAEARVPGSVVVDLSRMNRVIEVNEELAYVIVEPGVSFADLDDHLRAIGSDLMISVPDLAWGSVIGNTLERGFGYTAHGEHSTAQCGMEVVLADGDVVRTGMGALAGSTAWGIYRGGYGPSVDGLFSQSNLGIVTKMGVWLMPRPERVAACLIKAPEVDDLGPLVDLLRPLLIDGTVQSNAMVGNVLAIASMLTTRSQWYSGDGAMPDEAIRGILAALPVGWWNARLGLYGTEELVQARLNCIERAVARVPGAELVVNAYPGDADRSTVFPPDRAQLGIPSMDAIRMAGWRGGEAAHTDFSLVVPPTAADALKVSRLMRERVELHGFDYAGGFTMFRRHAIALCLISFDSSSEQERAGVADLTRSLMADARAAGYAPYRSHIAFMDLTARQYDFNDHASMRLNQRLKDALDPDGILSPGKQGIWPSAHRRVDVSP